jgi:integrase
VTIHKRGDRYQVRVDLGRDPRTGKRRQISATFRLLKDAERWERARLADRDRGITPTFDRRPLAEYLYDWLNKRRGLRDSSRLLYRRRIANYIEPYLGAMPLCELRAVHIHDLIYGSLAGKRLAGWTLRKTLSLLRDALGDAEQLDLIPRNEARRVEMPPAEATEPKHFTAAQLRRYLAIASRDPYWPLWLIAAHAGMRRGELCGLRWGDLDSEQGFIAVVQQVTPQPIVGRDFGPLKTPASRRLVALPPSLIAELLSHKARQNERRLLIGRLWVGGDNDLIFPNDVGQPMHPSVVTEHHGKLCQEAGLQHIRLHDLRHTASSLLHELGVPMRVVGNQLGHADLDSTAHYTHADMEGQKRAAAALEGLIGEVKKHAL